MVEPNPISTAATEIVTAICRELKMCRESDKPLKFPISEFDQLKRLNYDDQSVAAQEVRTALSAQGLQADLRRKRNNGNSVLMLTVS